MFKLINNNPQNFKISTDDMYAVLNSNEPYVLLKGGKRLEINKHGEVHHDPENPTESLAAALLVAFYDNGMEMSTELVELVLVPPTKTRDQKKTRKS
ncbi:TPA: hypothetical protein I4G69_003794 [Enterobacter asburiae]|nr:hypothetical protein [Enterobacter asburiae]